MINWLIRKLRAARLRKEVSRLVGEIAILDRIVTFGGIVTDEGRDYKQQLHESLETARADLLAATRTTSRPVPRVRGYDDKKG